MNDNSEYYKSKKFRRLLQHYEEAIAEGQTPYFEADDLTDIAEFYMTGKQDAKATQAIQIAIDMHPDSVDPQIFLARQKMFYGQLAEAHAIADAITEQDDIEVIYLQAELIIKDGQPDKASNFLEQQMSAMHDDLENFLHDCASIFMDYDLWDLAEYWTELLQHSFPNYHALPIMKAEIRMAQNDYEAAAQMLEAILDEHPFNAEAWNLLTETYNALERYPEAIDAADYSLAINPDDSNAMAMKSTALIRLEHYQEALDMLLPYYKEHSDDLMMALAILTCYSLTENYDKMLDIIEGQNIDTTTLILEGRTEDIIKFNLLKAQALCEKGRHEESIEAMEFIEPMLDERFLPLHHQQKGYIYLHAGKLDLAEKQYAVALEKAEDQGDMLYRIAQAYLNTSHFDQAIDLFFDTWTICGEKEGRFVIPYLARCYQMQGNVEKFLAYLKYAAQVNREETEYLFHDSYPGVLPEDYYAYAYREEYGFFPKDDDNNASLPKAD